MKMFFYFKSKSRILDFFETCFFHLFHFEWFLDFCVHGDVAKIHKKQKLPRWETSSIAFSLKKAVLAIVAVIMYHFVCVCVCVCFFRCAFILKSSEGPKTQFSLHVTGLHSCYDVFVNKSFKQIHNCHLQPGRAQQASICLTKTPRSNQLFISIGRSVGG